jgi:hypothetical protein
MPKLNLNDINYYEHEQEMYPGKVRMKKKDRTIYKNKNKKQKDDNRSNED